MSRLVKTLTDGGFTVIEGKDAVLIAIEGVSDASGERCSGYGVFPGGRKCKGCEDCNK